MEAKFGKQIPKIKRDARTVFPPMRNLERVLAASSWVGNARAVLLTHAHSPVCSWCVLMGEKWACICFTHAQFRACSWCVLMGETCACMFSPMRNRHCVPGASSCERNAMHFSHPCAISSVFLGHNHWREMCVHVSHPCAILSVSHLQS